MCQFRGARVQGTCNYPPRFLRWFWGTFCPSYLYKFITLSGVVLGHFLSKVLENFHQSIQATRSCLCLYRCLRSCQSRGCPCPSYLSNFQLGPRYLSFDARASPGDGLCPRYSVIFLARYAHSVSTLEPVPGAVSVQGTCDFSLLATLTQTLASGPAT